MDDVAVGQQQAIRSENETRTGSSPLAVAAASVLHFQVGDRRSGALGSGDYGGGVTIERGAIAGRSGRAATLPLSSSRNFGIAPMGSLDQTER